MIIKCRLIELSEFEVGPDRVNHLYVRHCEWWLRLGSNYIGGERILMEYMRTI